ncbi:RNA polymerase sigma factor [Niabella sp. 22666]|uniref:RNA polymerase sigma factor n=1 Tax=Niabella sp. 22666 TaxID=3453954 RepID=UPI003F82484C
MITVREPGSYTGMMLCQEDVFKELVQQYTPKLLPALYSITRCMHTAEDILQDSFLKLWSKRQEVVYDNPGGWLYRVATHEAYKHLKKEARCIRSTQVLTESTEQLCFEGESRLMYKEQLQQLQTVFTRLPQMQRKVYWLNREVGLNRNEIASFLNISANTVKVHLMRAHRFVKSHMTLICIFCFFNIFYFNISNTKPLNEDLYIIQESGHEHSGNWYSEKEMDENPAMILQMIYRRQQ